VSHRWRALADDQTLWRDLCHTRGWEWKQAHRVHTFNPLFAAQLGETDQDSDDEGMGTSDEEDESYPTPLEHDSGFASMLDGMMLLEDNGGPSTLHSQIAPPSKLSTRANSRHSAPSSLPSATSFLKPNYKLLHQTRIRLHSRFLSSSYRLSALQTRGGPTNAHTNTIYCLQLYTYPETGVQVLFTGSRDRTIREWNLSTGSVTRVIGGVHEGSVLSICVHGGYIASAGSDRRVAVWDLADNKLVKVIGDHEDSVLCVRFDDQRLVSCSKGKLLLPLYGGMG
jgi:WD40 repeat protein